MISSTCLVRIKYGFSFLRFTTFILSISYLSVFFIQDFIYLNLSLLIIIFYFYHNTNLLFQHHCKDWYQNFIEQIVLKYKLPNGIEYISLCSDTLIIEKSKKPDIK